jgi:RimJ/RimL family protein N-acetyltransferase
MTADASASAGAAGLLRAVELRGGGAVTLRLLQRTDREAFAAFTATLPEHDLLFLRIDITDPAVIDGWLDNVDLGRTVTIVAERDGRILGYGSLHFNNATWSQHVGEIRVLIGEEMRGVGLGRTLTEAIFTEALGRGIEKIVAQMTIDQKGAIATFEQLGFKPEALLRDHVKDRRGEKHDLLIFSHDVRAFQSQLDAYGVSEVAGGA